MMKKEKYNQGFTLTEVIVAIVISSIVFTLTSYLFVRFVHTQKEIKAMQQRTLEQNVVVAYFDSFANKVNLQGEEITIDYEKGMIASSNMELEKPFAEEIIVDNQNHKIKYNGDEVSLSRVKEIQFIPIDASTKLFMVQIVFDNDSTYQFSTYIIGGITNNAITNTVITKE